MDATCSSAHCLGSNTSGVIAFCASDASSPGELFMLTHGAEARVTDLNPWLHDRYVAQPEQHYFTAPDGWRLEGWILKPQGHDPDRVYPTVLEIRRNFPIRQPVLWVK